MSSIDYTFITKVPTTYDRPGFNLVLFEVYENKMNYDELKYLYSPPVREEHHMYPMVSGSALCLRL